MRNETRKAFILKLDGMIAGLQQSVILGGRSVQDSEACELLKDARLKFVEQLEGEDAPPVDLVAEMYERIESPGYNELPEDDPLFVHPEDRQ